MPVVLTHNKASIYYYHKISLWRFFKKSRKLM